ncbi:TenA family transcriptional regulator [Pantoea sp. 1.19]|uniref:TenA family transcriptional regulator n=1 Tax=Pantoea sp. 1.19 TaxID=1925589 RepID=UPI0009490D76|nr:iron-containing redox enzyme family protein [Pantoea sp. 1.19]
MTFYQQLQQETAEARQTMLAAPAIAACQRGEISVAMYRAFLSQAFYHVSHTVPLMMAAGSRLPPSREAIRGAIAEYIEEEYGHQQWILNDIRACGGDAEAVRHGKPVLAIELMIAFLYDQIQRVNPLSIFGMVQVLEGTSVAIASTVADQLQRGLALPEKAMSYLRSHGALDVEHLAFFEQLMNTISDPQDQADIIHAAKVVYQLYGEMLRGLTETSS